MDMKVGDLIGDYEILQILGAGGMGKVYKVRNTISNRTEAAKVLLPDLAGNPDLADRFMREIRVLATLDHPNVAKLHTAQRLNNQLLMIMEFIEGATLEDRLNQGRLPVSEGLEYIRQMLAALGYAHERGIIHRDVKPANVMITAGGVVKLMDFGIAKAVADHKLTQTGFTVGSLYYMSPEQIRGDTQLDARTDLYSLGISLYETVTGKRPFEGDSQYSVMQAHLQHMPRPPLELDPTLPEDLNEIILMSLAKEPEKRFQTATAFQRALESVGIASHAPMARGTGDRVGASGPAAAPTVTAPATAKQPEPWEQPRPVHSGRNRFRYLLAGSLATIALLVVAVTQIPKWRSTSAGQEPTETVVTEPAEPSPQTPAAAQSETPVSQPTSPPAETSAPDAETPAPEPVRTTASRPGPAPQRQISPAASKPQQTATEPAAVTAEPPVSAPAAVSPPVEQPAPTAPQPDMAALAEARERLMLMSTRVGAARSSIDTLRRSMEASGLGLRNDIATSEQRLTYYLDEAENALKQQDAEGANKYLGQAERELRNLEKFLGR